MKGSDEDLAVLWPDASEELVAGKVLGRGAAAFVVTKGEHGATWWSAAGRVDVHPVTVEVVDTIGAGDTFGAALVDALWSLGAVGAGAGERVAALTPEQVHGRAGPRRRSGRGHGVAARRRPAVRLRAVLSGE